MSLEAPPYPRQRRQQAYSSPSWFAQSPTDSGYGSAPTTPIKPEPADKRLARPCADLWMLGDGNQSDTDDPFVTDNENPFGSPATVTLANSAKSGFTPQKHRKPATLPLRSSHSRPALPSSFFSESRPNLPRRGSNTGPGRGGTGSLRLLDRFIPTRTHSTTTSEKFRTGKAPHTLTSTEKLLRHNAATEDAFCYRRRNVTPMAANFRSQSRSETAGSRNRGNRLASLVW